MAKKRRQVRSALASNELTKPLPIKRPRRGAAAAAAASKNDEPSPIEPEPDLEKSSPHKNGTESVDLTTEETPQEEIQLVTVEDDDGSKMEIVITDCKEEVVAELPVPSLLDDSTVNSTKENNASDSDSSDSSSDSDSSSSSDSDSSDSDSKSGTREATPVQPQTAPVVNMITNSHPVPAFPTKAKSSSSDSYHSDTEEEDKKRRKKQKNLQRQIMAKRARRSALSRGSRSDVLDDDDEEIAGNCDDVPDWPEEDFGELLRRIEEQLSPKDNLKFDSRASKLDWSRIKFKDYTTDECYDVWTRISKRIRRFRTLSEMLVDARDWITKPWTNFYRGTKKNRHPDMPSRPLSTYMIYYLEQKDRVSAENPGLEMTLISKIISEQYKILSDVEKDKYTELAAKERANFDEKLSEFYKDHPEMVPQQQPRSGWRDNAKGPRKPCAPFKLYFQDQVKRFGENGIYDRKTIEDMSKESWRAMSDKKKLIWITWSLEDLKRYEEELQKYQADHPDFVPPVAAKNVLNKDERCIKERLAGKPIKPPNSAYSYFSRFMLQSDEEVKTIPPKLRMAEISRKWKEISDAQKTKYEETVRELQEQYKLEFASYLEGLSKEEREEELKKCQPKRKSAAVKVEPDPPPPSRKQPSRAASGSARRRAPPPPPETLNLYKGEPAPPPVRAYDLFLKNFLAERPGGTSESQRLKEAPRYWEVLAEAKKEVYRKILGDQKQKYIKDYEIFLKGLSPDELKEFSVMKTNSKRHDDNGSTKRNGALSDSDSESEKALSSSGSESDGEGNVSDASKSSSSQSDV